MRMLIEREGHHDEVSLSLIIISYMVNILFCFLEGYMMTVEANSTVWKEYMNNVEGIPHLIPSNLKIKIFSS